MIARNHKGDPASVTPDSLLQELQSLKVAATSVPRRLKRLATIKLLRKKVKVKRAAVLAGAGLAAALIAMFTVAALIALVLVGLSAGLAQAFGLPWWAGALVTGVGALVTAAAVAALLWRRFAASQRRSIAHKLEAVGLSHYRPNPDAVSTHSGTNP